MDKVRIGDATENEREVINFLTPEERKIILVQSGRKKMEIAMMSDDERAEKNEQLKDETIRVTTLSEEDPAGTPGPQSWGGAHSGTQMVSWQQLDGWYGCLQGATNGIWFEGEDQGPYASRETIERFLRDEYEHPEEEIDLHEALED